MQTFVLKSPFEDRYLVKPGVWTDNARCAMWFWSATAAIVFAQSEGIDAEFREVPINELVLN